VAGAARVGVLLTHNSRLENTMNSEYHEYL
jgi:hypothetical protein